jgi:hypothetical protein
VAARVGRRGGKTYADGSILLDGALARHEAVCYYITQRLTRAKDLMWDSPETGLKKVNQDLGAGMLFNNTHCIARVPQTASMIRLYGAETMGDIDKLRGEPGAVFIIDEVRNFDPRKLLILIRDVLIPSTMDYGGRIILNSNPGHVLAGPFYDATKPESDISVPCGTKLPTKYHWSTHHWTAEHNEAMPHIWKECLEYKASMGWPDNHPVWMREYLAEWAPADSGFVFRFDPEKNVYDPDPKTPHGLPPGHDWQFICGMDFGVVDDFALVVMATAPTSTVLYETYTFSQPQLTIREMVDQYRHAESLFGGFAATVGDIGGMGKMAETDFARDHRIYIEPAQKTAKLGHIEFINSDLFDGRVKVRRGSRLIDELSVNQWRDALKKDILKGQKDHASDAFIYTYRKARHHEEPLILRAPTYGSKEWFEEQAKNHRHSIKKRRNQEARLDLEHPEERLLDNSGISLLGFETEWGPGT